MKYLNNQNEFRNYVLLVPEYFAVGSTKELNYY